jgi:PBP1b-binding outer membrane lipoprotein LpoB
MMKKILVLLLILVVLVSGCVATDTNNVDNPEGAAEVGQNLGEGLGDMTSDLNDMIDGLD